VTILLNGDTGILTPGLTNTGSTTLVSLTTTGNTILGDQSTDTLNVANGNLVLNSSGNLGIGTASPTARVHVSAPDGTAPLTLNTAGGSDTTRALNFNVAGDNYGKILVASGSGGAMAFWTGGANAAAERARITSDGNLGIGTASPSARLHTAVDGAGESDIARFSRTNGADVHFLDIGVNPDTNFVIFDSTGSAAGGYTFRRGGTDAMTLSAGGVLTVTENAVIQGLTVGRGASAVSTNTAVGAAALGSNTSGSYNVALGSGAGQANTTGIQSTFVGGLAGGQNTTGSITAVGYAALYGNTTGTNNVAVGNNNGTGTAAPLQTNTTGSQNTAVGHGALGLNTTASYNTAIGYTALYSNTTGTENTAIGRVAGYANVTGSYNAFLGHDSGYSSTSSYNTYVGHLAGYNMTTGAKNTILGRYSGNQGGLDIRTASNYIVLSDGDGNPRFYANSTAGYGSNAPQAWLEASLLWGTSGSAPHVSGGKAISNDNSGLVTIRAEIRTEVYEWQSGYAFVRASSINADATGGACAWWILGYRAFNGGITFFGLADSGGNTGSLTLTASDATSGTTSKALAQLRVTGGNNRTVMDVELIAYNEVLTITRS